MPQIVEATLTGMGTASAKAECGIFLLDIIHREVHSAAESDASHKARQTVIDKVKATVTALRNSVETVSHFSASPLGAVARTSASQQTTHEARAKVKVTFRDQDWAISERFAIEAIGQEGVTISSIDWRLDDSAREALHAKARTAACNNANALARQYAKDHFHFKDLSDASIRCVSIDERPYYTYSAIESSRPNAPSRGSRSPPDSVSTEFYFTPEDVQVAVNVNCRYYFDMSRGLEKSEMASKKRKLVDEGVCMEVSMEED